MREWVLAEVNYGFVKEHHYEVAVLPMGATEPHNLHLPYGTDTFQVDELAARAGAAAFQQGAPVIVLPTIPYGTDTNLMAFPLTMNLNPTTLALVLTDLVKSLEHHGIRKLVILNGHGGNDFKPVLRELYGRTSVYLFLCDWFRGLTSDAQAQLFEEPGDHAGEVETSLGLAFFPDLVRHNPQTGLLAADDGEARPSRLNAINVGWASITRPWHLLTTNTGCGNPHAASAEKGQQLMNVAVTRLAAMLVEIAAAEIDATFPF